ncbi:MAG: ATP-binding protein [Coleofasciculaceae cyanobacterium RL_1_1]|nr:ATP-binding protein [Coleofasciculaceae cyanobacterium RL_1_1]
MLQRLYVHNYRCLENFEVSFKDLSSGLLVGENGVGKSTIRKALEVLQKVGRGASRVGELVSESDIVPRNLGIPVRFELEVLIDGKLYDYALALERPENFKEFRVLEEKLSFEREIVYSRSNAQVERVSGEREIQFLLDWHLVGLPMVQVYTDDDPIEIFRDWLRKRMVIISPIPELMHGESREETLELDLHTTNFADWFTTVLGEYPSAYGTIDRYLKDVLPDLNYVQNEKIGKGAKNIVITFEGENGSSLEIDFENLSEGEKCFFVCATLVASSKHYGPLFCFWDEPDNYLSLPEVSHFITSLRKVFKRDGGQILLTSHHEETIRCFSEENTFIVDRKSHLEPSLIRKLSDTDIGSDQNSFIHKLILGDVEL